MQVGQTGCPCDSRGVNSRFCFPLLQSKYCDVSHFGPLHGILSEAVGVELGWEPLPEGLRRRSDDTDQRSLGAACVARHRSSYQLRAFVRLL